MAGLWKGDLIRGLFLDQKWFKSKIITKATSLPCAIVVMGICRWARLFATHQIRLEISITY